MRYGLEMLNRGLGAQYVSSPWVLSCGLPSRVSPAV